MVGALICGASVAINAVGAISRDAANWNAVPEDVDLRPERIWDWQQAQFLAPFLEPVGPYLPIPPDGIRPATNESASYLGSGWALPEGDFRWTDGRSARVRFAMERSRPGSLEMDFRAYLVPGKLDKQRLQLSLNGHPLQTLEISAQGFAPHTIPVPGEYLARENVLGLRLPDASSPQSLERSGDGRLLGVAVRSIRWAEAR